MLLIENLTVEFVSIVKIAVGAAIGAFFTYLIGRRKNQAEITNMEIGGFAQLHGLVQDLAKDVATLQKEKKELEKRLILAEKAIEDERKQFKEMLTTKDEEIRKLMTELKTEKEISVRQQREIDALRKEINELKEIISSRKK